MSDTDPEAPRNKREPLAIPAIEPSSPLIEKQAALDTFLRNLSMNQTMDEEDARRAIDFLRMIYGGEPGSENEFRHSHASIFEIMVGDYDPDAKRPDHQPNFTTTQLANNIGLLQAVIEDEGDEALMRKFRKLKDHVELEHKRINYIVRQNRLQYETSYGDSKRMEREIARFNNELSQATNDLGRRIEDREEQLDRMQREYIAILGILAAVVIASNGGIVFTASSIQALAGQNVFYLAFVITLVGGFLFNLLFALFTFIYRMVRQNGSYWGILSKNAFIRVNKWIISILAALFITSSLVFCWESGGWPFGPKT